MRSPEARYQRFPPPADLQAYVEHIWMVEAPGGTSPKREILIPGGRPSVVTCLATPGIRHDPLTGTSHPNGNVAFGITTRPYVLEQHGDSSYVGAQLTPWGLGALRSPGRPIDAFVRLEEWLGSVLESLRAAVDIIDEARGVVPVQELAATLRISYSSLFRLFRNHLGVGPKQFCEITRYYRFVGGLLGETDGSSAALLAELHGYYDQAHAARDFKRFTGVSARHGLLHEGVRLAHRKLAVRRGIQAREYGRGSRHRRAIMKRGYQAQPAIPWIEVDDIDAAIGNVRDAGGSAEFEKNTIPGQGHVVYVRDTEGNLLGLRQPH